MKNGLFTATIHGYVEFFKYTNGQVFGLETGKKNAWFPTLLCPKREETLKPITLEEAKELVGNSPDLEIIAKHSKALEEDTLAFIRTYFANKKMGTIV